MLNKSYTMQNPIRFIIYGILKCACGLWRKFGQKQNWYPTLSKEFWHCLSVHYVF